MTSFLPKAVEHAVCTQGDKNQPDAVLGKLGCALGTVGGAGKQGQLLSAVHQQRLIRFQLHIRQPDGSALQGVILAAQSIQLSHQMALGASSYIGITGHQRNAVHADCKHDGLKAQSGCAVALMAEVACVVLTEGVVPDETLRQRAEQQNINILGTKLSTFDAASVLKQLLR